MLSSMAALFGGPPRLPSQSSSHRRRFRSPESKPCDAIEADDSALQGRGFNYVCLIDWPFFCCCFVIYIKKKLTGWLMVDMYIFYHANLLSHYLVGLESLPVLLQRHYSVMRDLDNSMLVLQRQNEQRCEQEIEEIKNGIQCHSIKYDSRCTRFSDEALDEQKHCIQISDEKVALAFTAYDVVDRQIQQLDEYLQKCEVIRREREMAVATGEASLNAESNNTNSKTGRGLRKKYKTRLAEAADVAKLHSLGLQLALPVDHNEPTYCLCNQVSYGEMVACDNPAVSIAVCNYVYIFFTNLCIFVFVFYKIYFRTDGQISIWLLNR